MEINERSDQQSEQSNNINTTSASSSTMDTVISSDPQTSSHSQNNPLQSTLQSHLLSASTNPVTAASASINASQPSFTSTLSASSTHVAGNSSSNTNIISSPNNASKTAPNIPNQSTLKPPAPPGTKLPLPPTLLSSKHLLSPPPLSASKIGEKKILNDDVKKNEWALRQEQQQRLMNEMLTHQKPASQSLSNQKQQIDQQPSSHANPQQQSTSTPSMIKRPPPPPPPGAPPKPPPPPSSLPPPPQPTTTKPPLPPISSSTTASTIASAATTPGSSIPTQQKLNPQPPKPAPKPFAQGLGSSLLSHQIQPKGVNNSTTGSSSDKAGNIVSRPSPFLSHQLQSSPIKDGPLTTATTAKSSSSSNATKPTSGSDDSTTATASATSSTTAAPQVKKNDPALRANGKWKGSSYVIDDFATPELARYAEHVSTLIPEMLPISIIKLIVRKVMKTCSFGTHVDKLIAAIKEALSAYPTVKVTITVPPELMEKMGATPPPPPPKIESENKSTSRKREKSSDANADERDGFADDDEKNGDSSLILSKRTRGNTINIDAITNSIINISSISSSINNGNNNNKGLLGKKKSSKLLKRSRSKEISSLLSVTWDPEYTPLQSTANNNDKENSNALGSDLSSWSGVLISQPINALLEESTRTNQIVSMMLDDSTWYPTKPTNEINRDVQNISELDASYMMLKKLSLSEDKPSQIYAPQNKDDMELMFMTYKHYMSEMMAYNLDNHDTMTSLDTASVAFANNASDSLPEGWSWLGTRSRLVGPDGKKYNDIHAARLSYKPVSILCTFPIPAAEFFHLFKQSVASNKEKEVYLQGVDMYDPDLIMCVILKTYSEMKKYFTMNSMRRKIPQSSTYIIIREPMIVVYRKGEAKVKGTLDVGVSEKQISKGLKTYHMEQQREGDDDGMNGMAGNIDDEYAS